jgi:hypothetical protein
MKKHGVIHAGVGGTVAAGHTWAAQLRALVMKALGGTPTDWKFDTSGGFEASVKGIGIGAGDFYLKWKDESTRYKLPYIGASMSVGWPPFPSLTISSDKFGGGGVGRLYYLPGSSELLLKHFPGPYVVMQGIESPGVAGMSASLVFLGSQGVTATTIRSLLSNPLLPFLAVPTLAMFKAVGIVGGVTVSTPNLSVGVGNGQIINAYAG